jgi:hypothetical protein
MTRRVVIALSVCVVASGTTTADPPKPTPALPIQLIVATLKDDKLVYVVTQRATVTEYEAQTRTENGRTVTVMVPVQKEVDQKVTLAKPMSELKATGTTGKEVPAADLKEKLKAGVPVVLLSGPLDPEWRVLFKTGTVFLEPTNEVIRGKSCDTFSLPRSCRPPWWPRPPSHPSRAGGWRCWSPRSTATS